MSDYLNWAARQFENTGIDTDTFASSGGGGVNPFRKYKRDFVPNTTEQIAAYKSMDESKRNLHRNLLTPQAIAQDKRLDEYVKNCDILGKEKALKIYEQTTI